MELERALRVRAPSALHALQPGIQSLQVRQTLRQAGVAGDSSALVELFGWRGGLNHGADDRSFGTSIFPESIYQFMDLETACSHYKSLQQTAGTLAEVTGDPTDITGAVRKYFPVFWDGSSGFLGVDVFPSHLSAVAIIEFESPEPYLEVYKSFEDFLVDAIEANLEDRPLSCF